MSLESEAVARTAHDGIPRTIVDGKIMKYDWFFGLDELQDALVDEKLEEYIAKLMAEQINE